MFGQYSDGYITGVVRAKGRPREKMATSLYPGSDPLAGWLGWPDGEAGGLRPLEIL